MNVSPRPPHNSNNMNRYITGESYHLEFPTTTTLYVKVDCIEQADQNRYTTGERFTSHSTQRQLYEQVYNR